MYFYVGIHRNYAPRLEYFVCPATAIIYYNLHCLYGIVRTTQYHIIFMIFYFFIFEIVSTILQISNLQLYDVKSKVFYYNIPSLSLR